MVGDKHGRLVEGEYGGDSKFCFVVLNHICTELSFFVGRSLFGGHKGVVYFVLDDSISATK